MAGSSSGHVRARDLGIVIGEMAPGPLNAITDVAGVRVGHATIVRARDPWWSAGGPSGRASR